MVQPGQRLRVHHARSRGLTFSSTNRDLGATQDALRAGQLVEFGVSQGVRGMQAEQVVVLETDEGPTDEGRMNE